MSTRLNDMDWKHSTDRDEGAPIIASQYSSAGLIPDFLGNRDDVDINTRVGFKTASRRAAVVDLHDPRPADRGGRPPGLYLLPPAWAGLDRRA